MRILVLGGDGFLGSHLVDQVVELGHEVTVFDRFPYGVSRNLEHLHDKITFISGELTNREMVAKALTNQDIIYHFICATNPIESWHDPHVEIDENLRSSIQLFELAEKSGAQKIVFPSSGGTVYGPQSEPVSESVMPRPFSPYGITKLATEHFLTYFQLHGGMSADVYRIGNAYGPRQPNLRAQGVIAVWMSQIIEGKEIELYGDETTLRDYVFVKDIAYLMTHSLRDPNSSDLYNVGTGIGTNIIELLHIFQTVVDGPIHYIVRQRRTSDNASIVLDSSKILSFFPGFRFKRLAQTLLETWQDFKDRYSNKKSNIYQTS